jgi:hypothetical protein
VLNVSREINNFFEDEGKVTYKRILISDDRDADIMVHFAEVLAFIDGVFLFLFLCLKLTIK